MAFVLLPSRNRIVQAAFAGLRADERKAKKSTPAEEVAPRAAAKKAPAKKKPKQQRRK